MLLIAIALYLRIVTTPPPDVALLFSPLLFLSAKANKVPVSFIISHHLIASRLVPRRLLLFFTAPHHAISSGSVARRLSSTFTIFCCSCRHPVIISAARRRCLIIFVGTLL